MKASDITEDVTVVAAAVAGSSYLENHPTLTAVFGVVAVAGAALTAALLKQGH